MPSNQLEASIRWDKGLRERLRGKGIGDREVAAFCVSQAKRMKGEILDRVSGKTVSKRGQSMNLGIFLVFWVEIRR